jgi:2-dehydropantoate 2-reductase
LVQRGSLVARPGFVQVWDRLQGNAHYVWLLSIIPSKHLEMLQTLGGQSARRKPMGLKIAIMGVGALGGYVGAHMAQAGEDVTFIDPWPEHVERMRATGLRISHLREVSEFTVKARALHLTEVQQLIREQLIDVAFVCVKSYDTAWATILISQYLSPAGFIVSLQNCMNEETIAEVVGWPRVVGCVASAITVELCEPGHVRRASGKGGSRHTVFRAGEVHGHATARVREVCRLVGLADSAIVTANLWGERWSKLVVNAMANGISACTGLPSVEMVRNYAIRRFATKVGSEAIRVGQALGYQLELIHDLDPEIIAKAGEGDAEAAKLFDERRLAEVARLSDGEHRPSMGQDVVKGRRTEIDLINGLVARKGAEVGVRTPANTALTDIVRRVERGEIAPDPRHLMEVQLD